MVEVSTSESFANNPEISNDKVYFIAVVSKVFKLPVSAITEIETIVRNEYTCQRSNKYFNVYREHDHNYNDVCLREE